MKKSEKVGGLGVYGTALTTIPQILYVSYDYNIRPANSHKKPISAISRYIYDMGY